MTEIEKVLPLCSSIEIHGEDCYQGRFEHLVGRGNQAERVLLERGEPIHFSELVREINHRLHPFRSKLLSERNLSGQMSGDKRFVPVGKSGKWGLSNWSINTDTIRELMREALIKANRAMTPSEIYEYVSSRRSVSRNSVNMYLNLFDLFAKTSRNHWGLADWTETQNAAVWGPPQTAAFVERLFKKGRTRVLDYHFVVQELMGATGLSKRQVRGLLAINPVIKTEKMHWSEKRRALFQPNYRERLEGVRDRIPRRKRTLRQEVADFVRTELENSPGEQMLLSEMVEKLVGKYARGKSTFYGYIRALEFVEKVEDEAGKIMYQLKRESALQPFPQVPEIKSAEVRVRVERALSFLNEADVDVSLFLLSKEFEATLKSYLEAARDLKKIHVSEKEKLSLNTMINTIKKYGIITDDATLSFLRQGRNDRAHGVMPSVTERRIMMAHADKTANMYIDYIKLFDDLRGAL